MVVVTSNVDQAKRDRWKDSGSILRTRHYFRNHQHRLVLPYLKESLLIFFFPISSPYAIINQPTAVFWEDGTAHDTSPNVPIVILSILNLKFNSQ